jgi:hypothetical protein
MTACILQAGYRIEEAPISYRPRKAKKLSPWRDGWPALAMLLRRRFGRPFRLSAPASIPTTPAPTGVIEENAIVVAEPALIAPTQQSNHPVGAD